MKKIFKTILITVIAAISIACSNKNENKLVIGVSPLPHEAIVSLVKDDLKKEGIDLEIVVFNDYVQPNLALKDKSLDANFFQHVPYMEEFGKKNDIDMVSVASIHLEPLKVYSDKHKSLDEVANLDKVSILIPNDPTNRGRALLLLESAGILKLKDNTKLDSAIEDIESMSSNITITELNSEQIGARLSEVDYAIINTNNALASNIDDTKSVFVESKDSPYANVITVLKGRENDEKIKKLVEALKTDKVKEFIEKEYKGEIIPAF